MGTGTDVAPHDARELPSCRRWGQKKGPFQFSAAVGCLLGGLTGGYKAPQSFQMPGTLHVLQVLPGRQGSGSPCQEGQSPAFGTMRHWRRPRCALHSIECGTQLCSAPWRQLCRRGSGVPPSLLAKAPPAWIRPGRGRIPPARPGHRAGRRHEVTVKLLREVSINSMLENIMVCGNLFVIVK